LVFRLLLL